MFITHEPTRSLVFHTDDPFAIREVLPLSRTLDRDDYNVAVKHSLTNVRVLRNMGFDAPLPPYSYPGKHEPMAHQRTMLDFQVTHEKCFNLSDPGTCKTAATCWAADLMMNEGVIQKAAIFAPLSTLKTIWLQEIFDTLMHRSAAIVHGSRERRAERLAMDVDFYIINHDGVSIPEVWKAIHTRKDIGLVIVDEGSLFRNSQADRYKLLHSMIRKDQWLWWITGGPCPNNPTDAWAQARIVNPANVPKFFGSFRRETMMQLTRFKWAPKVGSEKRAFEALQPAVRFKKADCIDLPPVITIPLYSPLSADQKIAFKAMATEMAADIAGHRVTAVNAADKINKVRQILCGAIKESDGTYTTISHGPRLQVLKDAIDGASAKVLIVVPFKGIIYALERELIAAKYTVGVLNGDVGINARDRIITDFKTTPDPHVLLCHPRVMAHGLNLTEADTLIFYAPIYSNDDYGQVIERFNRAGQKRNMTIIRIGSHPIEWQIYKMIDGRAVTQATLLDMYKSVALDGPGDDDD